MLYRSKHIDLRTMLNEKHGSASSSSSAFNGEILHVSLGETNQFGAFFKIATISCKILMIEVEIDEKHRLYTHVEELCKSKNTNLETENLLIKALFKDVQAKLNEDDSFFSFIFSLAKSKEESGKKIGRSEVQQGFKKLMSM